MMGSGLGQFHVQLHLFLLSVVLLLGAIGSAGQIDASHSVVHRCCLDATVVAGEFRNMPPLVSCEEGGAESSLASSCSGFATRLLNLLAQEMGFAIATREEASTWFQTLDEEDESDEDEEDQGTKDGENEEDDEEKTEGSSTRRMRVIGTEAMKGRQTTNKERTSTRTRLRNISRRTRMRRRIGASHERKLLDYSEWYYLGFMEYEGSMRAELTSIEENVPLSTPWLYMTFGGLVAKTQNKFSMWRIFAPFSFELWLAVGVGLFTYAALLQVLQVIERRKGKPRISLAQVVGSVYHVVAAALGGEDYEWITGAGRILRLSLLLFVFVTMSTYTANLAAFFTAKSVIIHGPKDMASLHNSKACMRQDAWTNDDRSPDSVFKPFVGSLVLSDNCLDLVKDFSVDIWIGPMVDLTNILMDHCSDMELVPGISFAHRAFVVECADHVFCRKMSAAITWLRDTPEYSDLLANTLGVGRSCPEVEIDDTERVTLESTQGLFYISGSVAAIAVVFALFKRFCASRVYQSFVPDHTATDGEMLHVVLGKMNEIADAKSSPEPSDPISAAAMQAGHPPMDSNTLQQLVHKIDVLTAQLEQQQQQVIRVEGLRCRI